MSTGLVPSIEGMMVRCSPAPVIARIRDWSSRIVSTSTPCTTLRPASDPATAAPSTTRVHDATSTTTAHSSGSPADFAFCDTFSHPSWR